MALLNKITKPGSGVPHYLTAMLTVLLPVLFSSVPPSVRAAKTRVVHTKYGSVQGFIRPLGHLLGDVEVFKGIPYASAPIEEGRFTPTNSPTPWEGVRDMTQHPPVCPQLLPDVDSSMTDERAEYIRTIRPSLSNQSEDCLTLSIYSPILVIHGSEVFPVLVYLHGESFSWGSGSLYDGSVLAAYGRVVVVTVNYRLGPLGFLNSYPGGGSPGVASNFALLDQIAALSWLTDNIGRFHGDRTRVTLVGRDTGAACITYLMDSPVMPPGLFHRAVLLSGGSWCSWASVSAPLSNTIKLALTLDCPVPDDRTSQYPPTVECLRGVPLPTLMAAARTITGPAFTPAWGPSEDGVVVAKEIRGKHPRDLVLGFTPGAGWAWLPPELRRGVENTTFVRVARTLVRNTRRHHLRAVLAAALQEYTDWSVPAATNASRRQQLLQMLADALLLAPLHRAADAYSEQGKVFVFMGEAAQADQQFQPPGWELGLLWGMGLSEGNVGLTPTPPLAGPVLAQLSEVMITLLTNFAKSGDPNLPRESPSPGYAATTWPTYQPDSRRFLRIGVPLSLGSQYRAHQLALWSWLVPELEALGGGGSVGGGGAYIPDNSSWEVSDDPALFYGAVRPVDPWAFLDPANQNRTGAVASGVAAASTADPALAGRTSHLTTTLALSPTLASPSSEGLLPAPGSLMRYSTALLATLGLGVSLLLLNALVFGLVIWRRPRSDHRKLGAGPRPPELQSVSGALSQDAAPISVLSISSSPGGGSDGDAQYPSVRRSNLKKKRACRGALGVLPEYASASCDKLCPGGARASILRSSPSAHQQLYRTLGGSDSTRQAQENLHQLSETYAIGRESVLYSCGSPASSTRSSCDHQQQQEGGRRLPRPVAPATLDRPDRGILSRRQSIPFMIAGENRGPATESGSMTLPRQPSAVARAGGHRDDSAHHSRESCSTSLCDISRLQVDQDQQQHILPLQQHQGYEQQHQKELSAQSQQQHQQQQQQQHKHLDQESYQQKHDSGREEIKMQDHHSVRGSMQQCCQGGDEQEMQQADLQKHLRQHQQQSILHRNSPQPEELVTARRPDEHNYQLQQHNQQQQHQEQQHQQQQQHLHQQQQKQLHNSQEEKHGNEQITPFCVLDDCPPEFQNDRGDPVDVPEPPPPPRVTAHMFQQQQHQQQHPSSSSSSSISTVSSHQSHPQRFHTGGSLLHHHQLATVGHQCQRSSPPASQTHTSTILPHHRPRQTEKRVTIVEEGLHRL